MSSQTVRTHGIRFLNIAQIGHLKQNMHGQTPCFLGIFLVWVTTPYHDVLFCKLKILAILFNRVRESNFSDIWTAKIVNFDLRNGIFSRNCTREVVFNFWKCDVLKPFLGSKPRKSPALLHLLGHKYALNQYFEDTFARLILAEKSIFGVKTIKFWTLKISVFFPLK